MLAVFDSLYASSQTDGLLISENFPYSNGNLSGQGSSPAWTSTGTGGDVVVTALTDNSGALIYPGYTSGTSYITTSNANTRDPYKGFIGSQSVSGATATTFYISFVVRVANNSSTSLTFLASATVALRNSSGANLSDFYIADDGGSNLKFGISKNGTIATYASGNYSFNTTHLIVIRYDIATGGTTNDKMYLWVDPSLSSEPSTASANVSITTGNDGNTSSNISALQLLEDNFFGIDGTTASLDGFKVAYASGFASNSVVAWSDLSPAGAPLPVKFGDLKASLQANGVMLDWTSYSEENTDHYEIGRSSDGKSFSSIGQVVAHGNSSTRIDYNWLDAAPAKGDNFYRVKSVDMDGHLTYSPIIKITLGEDLGASMNIYPNPLRGSQLTLQFSHVVKGSYLIQIFNHMGQQVNQSRIEIAEENMTQTLQLPSSIKPGTYNLLISNGDMKFNKIFIMQ